MPITSQNYANEIFDERPIDTLEGSLSEVNHIIPIAVGTKLLKEERIKLNNISNCELLHKECHHFITYKK